MDYADISFDHSKSYNPPSPPLPVYHFQHIAAYKTHERAKERQKALDALRRRR